MVQQLADFKFDHEGEVTDGVSSLSWAVFDGKS